jgi:predicted ATPase
VREPCGNHCGNDKDAEAAAKAGKHRRGPGGGFLSGLIFGPCLIALASLERGISHAREIGQAATLMYALAVASGTNLFIGDYAAELVFLDELAGLAEEKDAMLWRVLEKCIRGSLLTMTGNPSDAVPMLTTGIAALRSTGATTWTLHFLPWLALAYAQVGKSDEAWHCIGGAVSLIEESNQRFSEAEVHRVAGEILLASAIRDEKKGEEHFAFALEIARQQQAKSWELRAAMSLAPGVTRARCSKRANCLLRFTGGSRRGSTRSI